MRVYWFDFSPSSRPDPVCYEPQAAALPPICEYCVLWVMTTGVMGIYIHRPYLGEAETRGGMTYKHTCLQLFDKLA